MSGPLIKDCGSKLTKDISDCNIKNVNKEVEIKNEPIEDDWEKKDMKEETNIEPGLTYVQEGFQMPTNEDVEVKQENFNEEIDIKEEPFDYISEAHTKKRQCYFCDKTFSYNSNLMCHLITHIGEKTFGKVYSVNSSLIGHLRTHEGKIIRQCHQCDIFLSQFDNSFSENSKLNTNMRINKRYQCIQCDEAFSEKSEILKHMKAHTWEKPYQCKHCDKTFLKKCSIVIHHRIHTGEDPYKCNQCDKAFSLKHMLINHQRIHSGEKPYKVTECDNAYYWGLNILKASKTLKE